MPRIFVCYGGKWKESEKEYEGVQLRGLIVDLGITYEDFLHQIYRISGINSDEFDLVIRCVYNIKPNVPAFVIRNEEDLHFFLTGEDVSQLALLVSNVSKEVHGGRSNVPSFPYTMGENIPPIPSFPSVFDNLQEDREALTCGESVTNVEPVADGDLATDVDVTNVEHVTDVELVTNGEPMTYGESVTDGKLVTNRESMTYGEAQRRNPTCQPSNNPVVISGQSISSDEDVEVGHLFLSKKELCMKLSVLAMKKNFEFRVKKSTLKLYIVKCVEESCKWRLRAIKIKGSDVFKVSRYSNVHTCSHQMKNQDHRQARSWVVGNLIKSKYEDVGRTYKPKDIVNDMQQEYGVNISYDTARRAREELLILSMSTEEVSIPKVVERVSRRHIRSIGETHQVHKCSRCGNMGHNKKTCRQPLTNYS